jgi:hypothetical protein
MLKGFIISRFRNFGDEDQLVHPLAKINIFIGENNSGKSNVIRFIRDVLSPLLEPGRGDGHTLSGISRPRFSFTEQPHRPVLVETSEEVIGPRLKGNVPANWHSWFVGHPYAILDGAFLAVPATRGNQQLSVVRSEFPSGVSTNLTQQIWHALTQRINGGAQAWHEELLNNLLQSTAMKLDVVYIPSFRQIETRLSEFEQEYRKWEGGSHIIDRLAELAYPPYDKQEMKKDFENLRRFIGNVIDRPDVSVEIPNDRKTINIKADRNFVPIEALGSGIHELFMLAAQIVLNKQSTILLEEPEVHMHPTLQRKFMTFLEEQEGQYFITTHSPHIIDTPGAAVFGVRNVDGEARIEPLLTNQSRRRMCEELGYRPSDLLQTNCVIWVEGPSDRIYLNHWLSTVDSEIREGVHYSMMFYGGKLLSHLSVEDAEVRDFVGLLPINRHPAIVMDSDRGSEQQMIRQTKTRVTTEMEEVGGFCWVTAGREIENYIPRELRLRAIRAAHPQASRLASSPTKFAKPLDFIMVDGRRVEKGFDKVRIARAVVDEPANLAVLDLGGRIAALARYVRHANGMQS